MENSFIYSLIQQNHLPLPLIFLSKYNADITGKMICALLNEKGGWIILGIDEEKNIYGLNNEKTTSIQEEINHITPLPLVYLQSETIERKNIVLITVSPGVLPPYTYKGHYYLRTNNDAVLPNTDKMATLIRDSTNVQLSWEGDQCLTAEDECFDNNLMHEVYQTGLNSKRLIPYEEGLKGLLSELRLLTVMSITNGAVALFSTHTQRLLPQCRIRIQLMLNGKTANEYNDTFYIEGNLFYCLHQTLSYFQNRLPVVSKFSTNTVIRNDMLLYPIEVLDEAITNALIHRDYTNRCDEITIFIYNDKLEITNPGEMPKNIIKSNTKILPHNSILRNPLMAEIFYIAGRMEKTGRGLILISNKMKELGRKPPEWQVSNGRTTLTIYLKKNQKQINLRITNFLNSYKSISFTRHDYQVINNISDKSAKNDISIMLDEGWIIRRGTGPSTIYELSGKSFPDSTR